MSDASSHSPGALRAGVRRATATLCALALASAAPANAQVFELDARNTVFYEPSSDSDMLVLTPAVTGVVTPTDWLSVNLGWEADIVSGASEPVKGGPLQSPDIISHASVTDFRNVFSGGFTLTRDNTSMSVGYSYGAESDYQSQSIRVAGATDFFQRNTRMEIAYAKGFDKVCNIFYEESLDPTLRPRLDSSDGCFTDDPERQEQDIDTDNFQAGWTQNWTPVFATQLVLTGVVQNGFLGNPYRSVVIGSTGDTAQENHPENRSRGAAALRGKYYVKGIETAFGLGVRGYRDSWDINSITVDADAERYLSSWLRARVRFRYYRQTEALFWSDDYTGGEPAFGPRGRYWSGDREVSPMWSYLIGARLLGEWNGRTGDRILGMLMGFRASLSLDMLDTKLEDFTWAGNDPNDTLALIGGASVTGSF